MVRFWLGVLVLLAAWGLICSFAGMARSYGAGEVLERGVMVERIGVSLC